MMSVPLEKRAYWIYIMFSALRSKPKYLGLSINEDRAFTSSVKLKYIATRLRSASEIGILRIHIRSKVIALAKSRESCVCMVYEYLCSRDVSTALQYTLCASQNCVGRFPCLPFRKHWSKLCMICLLALLCILKSDQKEVLEAWMLSFWRILNGSSIKTRRLSRKMLPAPDLIVFKKLQHSSYMREFRHPVSAP
jgi:hypothetical protein